MFKLLTVAALATCSVEGLSIRERVLSRNASRWGAFGQTAQPGESYFQQQIDRLDTNGNGQLDKSEFKVMAKGMGFSMDGAEWFIDFCDKDCSGACSAKELTSAFRDANFPPSYAAWKSMKASGSLPALPACSRK